MRADGTLEWQWDLSPFGEAQPTIAQKKFNPNAATTTSDFQFNLRYPGQTHDSESGLSYNYFRSYNPTTGRYTQPDPIGLEGGWNRFGYVGGNPLNYTDPSGLFRVCSVLTGVCTDTSPPLINPDYGAVGPDAPSFTWPKLPPDSWVDKIIGMCTGKKCPPCKTANGKIVPVGTIGYRFDPVPPGRPHHPYPGSHYNLYKANQYPAPKCDCFWQAVGAADGANGMPPPAGAIPIEPFAN